MLVSTKESGKVRYCCKLFKEKVLMQYVFFFSADFSFAFKDGPTTFWTTTPEAQVKSFFIMPGCPEILWCYVNGY